MNTSLLVKGHPSNGRAASWPMRPSQSQSNFRSPRREKLVECVNSKIQFNGTDSRVDYIEVSYADT